MECLYRLQCGCNLGTWCKKLDTVGYTYVIPFVWDIRNRETKSKLVVARDCGEGRMKSNCLMGMRFPFEVMKMFWNHAEMVITQHCEYTKCHWIAHLKMVDFRGAWFRGAGFLKLFRISLFPSKSSWIVEWSLWFVHWERVYEGILTPFF